MGISLEFGSVDGPPDVTMKRRYRSRPARGMSAVGAVVSIAILLAGLAGCHSPSRVPTQSSMANAPVRPLIRAVPVGPMLITAHGTSLTADGAWRIEVSESSLAISRSNAARGEGWTGCGWITISSEGWRAQAGWFVFVENESNVWAYEGDRQLLLQRETSIGNQSTSTTYSSRFPCAVPAEVIARLSEPARRAIQEP